MLACLLVVLDPIAVDAQKNWEKYTVEEFTDISITGLAKENIDEGIARVIAEKIWYELGSRDIRDVIKVARLANNISQVSNVVEILINHRIVELCKD